MQYRPFSKEDLQQYKQNLVHRWLVGIIWTGYIEEEIKLERSLRE